MQAIQAMGGMPPLPPGNAAPPPAPPPPEKPPPPPHENNQPLYGHTPSQPAPVPAPNSNQHQPSNSTINVGLNQPGNTSNWSNVQEPSPSSVNAEALKKLAEEERLFDIQFQKWEEEIEKWKKDNVNHPDKQAYKEYEEKFEACRAQLLERRQQMNKKKARLLGTAPPPPPPQPQSSNTKPASVNVTVPPPLLSTPTNAYPNKPQQSYATNSAINQKAQQGYGTHSGPNQDKQHQNYGNYSQNPMKQDQGFMNNSTQNYANNAQGQYQQYNMPQNAYNRSNNVNVQTQDRYNSYSQGDKYPPKDNFTAPPNNPSFLLASESNKKGIPGLDLVPDADKSFGPTQDVIDITGEKSQGLASSTGPDYSTISKGINNILGDEKIMNILSMVRGQVAPGDSINNSQTNQPMQRGPYSGNNQSNQYDQGYRNQNFNKPFDNRQNMPYNRQDNNYPMQQNSEGPRYPPQKRMMDERQDDMQQDSYNNYDRNSQYGGSDISPSYEISPSYDNGPARGGPARPNMSGSRPSMRPLLPEPGQQNMNDYSRGPPPPAPQSINDYPRGMHGPPGPVGSSGFPERRPLHENNMNPIPSQPARPKWIDEPMFSPSLIVEYEHKPLRLKGNYL